MQTPASLIGRGFVLRAAIDSDRSWMASLYASTRAAEMAVVPWPELVKQLFLDQQFALQHQHYLGHYPDTDYLVIQTVGGEPVGRYYLQRTPPDHLLVDISLFPRWRGQGIGTILIRQSQIEAATLGRGMRLHVMQSNPAAQRLYERLGFVAGSADAPGYIAMHWATTAR